MPEVWKAIPGWEGVYEVSSEGQVRSILHWAVQTNRWGTQMTSLRQGTLLRQTPNTRGYLCVGLNGQRRVTRARVHKLVAAAFLGPCPQGLYVLHNNGIQTDNRAINLRYGTQKDNLADAARHGVLQKRFRQPQTTGGCCGATS